MSHSPAAEQLRVVPPSRKATAGQVVESVKLLEATLLYGVEKNKTEIKSGSANEGCADSDGLQIMCLRKAWPSFAWT